VKILLTGASSFTGMWFAEALSEAGHSVTTTLRAANAAAYTEPIRRERVDRVAACTRVVYGCSFGDDRFVDLIKNEGPFDVLCHHGADVTNYKSADFDVTTAVANNTANLRKVLEALQATDCSRVALSGSGFEGGEGAGSQGLPHFSPYGLSKALTAEVFRYFVGQAGMRLGKFVIPNPFGPYEEPRFTAHLMRTWYAGNTPTINTPDYVRDNIHISLLARAYVRFLAALPAQGGFEKLNPSGYVEAQGAFARRFAREMNARLGLACPVQEAVQTEFPEPRIRLNTDALDARALGFDEAKAWDEVAAYYAAKFGPAAQR
jgi:UDP-glucose 4-epimerase